ncbi:AraC family transcriptional regulator [Hyalangium versicolor]|uniref:AraC family transcriptional regulator n=1 Tax=Hyalangium versicolor TaxID=2861190 RepID=UPI001CCB5F4E|nr:AraC family transcriptional regulator [Hyalangium versicolor]
MIPQSGGQPSQDVRTQLVGPFLAWLRAHGQDPAALVRDFQLPPDAESSPEISLPLSTLRAFLDAAEQQSGDAFIGLHAAQAFKRGTYGLVEYIARAAPTLRDTFRRLARYMALLNDRMVASFHEDATTGTFTYGVPGEPLSYGRHANEFGLALFVHVGRQLAGQPWNPLAVTFAHPAPPDCAPLTAHFGLAPSFGSGMNVLTLASSTLDLPVVSADPVLLSVLERAAGTPPTREPAPPEFVLRVHEAIRGSLRDGPPKMETVAKQLHVSARTLQRRLAEHHTTFQDVADAVRSELARQYLRDPHLGISEVAFRLGYSDLSTFDRAFKRWTGMTPREFRG